jgi:hypothetical protein
MKRVLFATALAFFVASPQGATPAYATSPVPVVFGTTWDGPTHTLQSVVDAYVGVPGAINVQGDFIGAHIGDLDPWFWVSDQFPALLITEVAGNANQNVVGWYKETGSKPVIDGIDDGIVFNGPAGAGASTLVTFPSGLQKFGFYMDPVQAGGPHQYFWTNRFYNDKGINGAGATHAPFDGDVQALVYDVSQWKGANTWLVCFEDIDSGRPITPCCAGVDNDFNDFVFQVTALGATPAQTISFGQLKARFAH